MPSELSCVHSGDIEGDQDFIEAIKYKQIINKSLKNNVTTTTIHELEGFSLKIMLIHISKGLYLVSKKNILSKSRRITLR